MNKFNGIVAHQNVIELYCDNGDLKWQRATFRIAYMHPPTLDRPLTLM